MGYCVIMQNFIKNLYTAESYLVRIRLGFWKGLGTRNAIAALHIFKEKICWLDEVTNEEVLGRIDEAGKYLAIF